MSCCAAVRISCGRRGWLVIARTGCDMGLVYRGFKSYNLEVNAERIWWEWTDRNMRDTINAPTSRACNSVCLKLLRFSSFNRVVKKGPIRSSDKHNTLGFNVGSSANTRGGQKRSDGVYNERCVYSMSR